MKKFLLGGMIAMLGCMMPGLTFAHGYGDGWDDHGGRGPHGKMMEGVHWMTGTVESVDQKAGWMKVKIEEGTLNLHFPPDSLKDVKTGDTVTVHLGFHKGAPAKMTEEKKKEEKKEEKPAKPAM